MKLSAYAFVIAAVLSSAAVAGTAPIEEMAPEAAAATDEPVAPELEINAAEGADVTVNEEAK